MRADSQPTGQQMMRGMNLWASVILGIGFILTGEVFSFYDFVSRYPFVIGNIGLLALTGALGQLFIYLMVGYEKYRRED